MRILWIAVRFKVNIAFDMNLVLNLYNDEPNKLVA